MASNMSDNMNYSLQQNVHNDQALQVLSAVNDSTMSALINFDNPKVKKALDNLIQSGPSILQNINAVSKNVNCQHLPANPPMDRIQASYNQYGIRISADNPDPQMMSCMGGRSEGGGGHSNVHPDMGMNAGMNMDPAGHYTALQQRPRYVPEWPSDDEQRTSRSNAKTSYWFTSPTVLTYSHINNVIMHCVKIKKFLT